ncbi:hypothetical protein [Streptomyces sp. NPDC002851]
MNDSERAAQAGHVAYCEPAAPSPWTGRHDRLIRADGPPYADCVLCGEPTEYAAASRGATLCPMCEWREAERDACSG